MDVLVLLLWGTMVGLDLISVGQVMISRPLVAATVAGLLTGDVSTGMIVGAILELFALEVMPVGGARYPDYGPAAVAATAVAAGAPSHLGVGLGVAVGLVVAYLGEWSIIAVRRWNSQSVRRAEAALNLGDVGAIRRAHWGGIGHDALRCFALTSFGLALAYLVRRWPLLSLREAVMLTAVTAGVALATAALAGVHLGGRPRGAWWFALGLVVGSIWVVVG
jgi:mannose/fructose/N-acetylgalactosamine-specific phosphotransferase system component IIC